MTHICITNLGHHHWFRSWLVTCSVPSHYLKQCLNIVNSNLRNKLQWNFQWNSCIFIKGNVLQNAFYKMAAVLSRPQCVDKYHTVILYEEHTNFCFQKLLWICEESQYYCYTCYTRDDSRFAPSQWETALLCNEVSHWLGASLESALLHWWYPSLYGCQRLSDKPDPCHQAAYLETYLDMSNGL